MEHKAKKSLGQNFLKSREAIQAICNAGNVKKDDYIVEIGPGKGILTEELLKREANVLAIEKDDELVEIINEKFEKEIKNKKLEIIKGDCLDFNHDEYFKNKKYKIIANIPYNITGAIIKKFLSEVKNKPNLMALLVQKEVAERIIVRDKKESILSLSVKAYGEPKYIMKVSKKYFSPAPKVDSAIILINNISDKNFKNKKEEELFFKVIKSGFSHKRKILIKNLSNVFFENGEEKILEIFDQLKIDNKIRAEKLNFEKWLVLTKNIDSSIKNK